MSPSRVSQRRGAARQLQEPQVIATEIQDLPTSNSPPASNADGQHVDLTSPTRPTPPLTDALLSPERSTNGKLESVAADLEDRQLLLQSEAEPKKKKSGWSPLDRYHSNANSFPDYARPNKTMASSSRLRAINASQNPANTLSQTKPSHVRQSHFLHSDEPVVKRQRQDLVLSTGTTSNFFARPKLTPKEEVQDLTTAEDNHDVYSIRSTSSAGRAQSAVSNVPEYRNAQPREYGKKSRKRKNRGSSGSQGLRESPASSFRASPVQFQGQELVPSRPPASDSNSADDLAGGSPPPANIGSDLSKAAAKRPLSTHLVHSRGPQIKKARLFAAREPSNDPLGEDELSQNGPAQKVRANSPTNVSFEEEGQQRQSRGRRSGRGDIKSTTFNGLRASKGLRLKRAAALSGAHTYDSDVDIHGPISLHFVDNDGTKPKTADGVTVPYDWLECNLMKALKVFHAATTSPHVIVRQSKTPTSPAQLFLEFDSITDAVQFIKRATRSSADEREPTQLKTIFDRTFEEAARHATTSNHAATPVSNGHLAHAEQDQHLPSGDGPVSAPSKADPPKREKLAERMLRSSREAMPQQLDLTEAGAPPRRLVGPETRFARRTSPAENPERWTDKNRTWDQTWQRSLVYPATGKNRATVDKNDIPRLDEGEFLNDNLISFYFKYLQLKMEKEHPELLQRIYFFSTFFFEKLRSTKGKINYDGVKAWTAKVDLFSYDYIVVPVNEHAHWYLAIICNVPIALNGLPDDDEPQELEVVDVDAAPSSPRISVMRDTMAEVSLVDTDQMTASTPAIGMANSAPDVRSTSPPPRTRSKRSFAAATKSDLKNDPRNPRIITLDSLGSTHQATCRYLRDYLSEEALHKKHVELKIKPAGLAAKGIDQQLNYCDCGVYVLGYMEEFLKDPDTAVRKLLQKEDVEWRVRPSNLRTKIRELLFTLQQEQARLDQEMAEKKRKKRAERGSGLSSPAIPSSRVQSQGVDGASTPKDGPTPSAEAQPASSIMPSSPPAAAIQTSPVKAVDEDPVLIRWLEEDSSGSGNTATETYHSAVSSPAPKENDPTGQINRSGLGRVEIVLNSGPPPGFLKTLSSSSSEVDAANDVADGAAQASVEFVSTNIKDFPPGMGKKEKRSKPRQSIEVDEPEQRQGGPRYDGIERTVDLTS